MDDKTRFVKVFLHANGLFKDSDWSFDQNGDVNLHTSLTITKCETAILPFKFGKADFDFALKATIITSLQNCPNQISGIFYFHGLIENFDFWPRFTQCLTLSHSHYSVQNYTQILLANIKTIRFATSGQDIWPFMKILQLERINGKMPRELIPGKINQLREILEKG